MKIRSRGGRRGRELLYMLSFAAGAAGCAKSPTEAVIYTGEDATVAHQITSLQVDVTGATMSTSLTYQSLGAPAADADIPAFTFPTILDVQLTRTGVSGPVQITVSGTDPTDPATGNTVLASAVVATTVVANQTTTLSVVLTAPPPSGAGGLGGEGGAGGLGGQPAAGGAGGDTGAGGIAGAGG